MHDLELMNLRESELPLCRSLKSHHRSYFMKVIHVIAGTLFLHELVVNFNYFKL